MTLARGAILDLALIFKHQRYGAVSALSAATPEARRRVEGWLAETLGPDSVTRLESSTGPGAADAALAAITRAADAHPVSESTTGQLPPPVVRVIAAEGFAGAGADAAFARLEELRHELFRAGTALLVWTDRATLRGVAPRLAPELYTRLALPMDVDDLEAPGAEHAGGARELDRLRKEMSLDATSEEEETTGARIVRAEAVLRYAGALMDAGEEESARSALRMALDLAHISGDRGIWARAQVELAELLERVGEVSEAASRIEAALPFLSGQDRHAECRARVALSRVLGRQGRIHEAVLAAESAAAAGREGHHPFLLCVSLMRLGSLEVHQGLYALAEQSFDAALQHARKGGHPEAGYGVLGQRSILVVRRGRLREGLAAALSAGEALRRVGMAQNRHACRAAAAEALLRLGELDRARELLDEALAYARERGLAELQAVSLRTLGGVARERGALDEARALLDQAVEVARARSMPDHLLKAQLRLAILALEAGDSRAAFEGAETVRVRAQSLMQRPVATDALALSARATLSLGGLPRARAAVRELERAVRQCREMGHGLSLPRHLAALCEARWAAGDDAGAKTAADEARLATVDNGDRTMSAALAKLPC